MRRGAERFFQSVGAYKRCGAVIFIFVPYLIGDFNPGIGLIQFLTATFLGEDRIKFLGRKGLFCSRIKGRQRLVGHLGLNIIPIAGDFFLVQQITLTLLFHDISFQIV